MLVIKPRTAIKGMKGFVPGRSDRTVEELKTELGLEEIVKLSFNESPYGPAPKVDSAIADAIASVHLYHDPEGKIIKDSLARLYGVEKKNIFFRTLT